MKKPLVIGAGILASLAAIVAGGLGFAFSKANGRLDQAIEVPVMDVTAPTDPISIERGRYLAATIGNCGECHGANLGGQLWFDQMPLARAIAPNLTTGANGVGGATDGELVRAIRNGIGVDGRALFIMPSQDYVRWSMDDTLALVAYIRTLPAVDGPPADVELGPVGAVLMATGAPFIPAERITHGAPPPARPTPGPTAEYGAYLSSACIGCHGDDLAGGKVQGGPPDWPPAANLTPRGNMGQWTRDQFATAVTTGVRPDGTSLSPVMPRTPFAAMTQDDITALYAFLASQPPRDTPESRQ